MVLYYNSIVIDMFDAIDTFIDTTLQGLGILGPIIGCFFILIESMVPILPLFVFITLNFLAYFLGIYLSWLFYLFIFI